MKNPFYLLAASPDNFFRSMEKEIRELERRAINCERLVMYAPIRYGKTSLVKYLQDKLFQKGVITVYVDLVGIVSKRDLASRIAKGVYRSAASDRALFEQAGKCLPMFKPTVTIDDRTSEAIISVESGSENEDDLLRGSLEGLKSFLRNRPSNIALDEFQEITRLKAYKSVGSLICSCIIDCANASCFFIGSRRKRLFDMFNVKSRPFYKSALTTEISAALANNAVFYVSEQLRNSGKYYPEKLVDIISNRVKGHPYYCMELARHIFEVSEGTIKEEDIDAGYLNLIDNERSLFKFLLRNLNTDERMLLAALAKEPVASVFQEEYILRHSLGSTDSVRRSYGKLIDLDYIRATKILDPVFGDFIKQKFTYQKYYCEP